MAEWTIRAVWQTELQRHMFNADDRRRAIMYSHNWIARQDGQPWRSGKIVLLDETGMIVSELPNLRSFDEEDEENEDDE